MKTLDRKTDIELQITKKSGIKKLHLNILKAYKKLGETNSSIDAINRLVEQYFRNFKESQYYLNKHKKIVNEAVESGDYQRFSLLDDGFIKLSLHVMPKGTKIPMHAHPDMFSVTFVDQGLLKIKKDSWGRLTPLNKKDTSLNFSTLRSNGVSTGLPVKNNLHQIESQSDGTVFMSMRFKLNTNQNLLERLFTKKNIAVSGVLMGLAMPFISLNGTAASAALNENGYIKSDKKNNSKDYSKLVLASEKEQIYIERELENHRIAAKFRNSTDYGNQVEAFNYYKKSALNGDAESQYWLGVMFLDGTGITEDDDLALDWISKSATQNYPPAEQLLTHLLATNFDIGC